MSNRQISTIGDNIDLFADLFPTNPNNLFNQVLALIELLKQSYPENPIPYDALPTEVDDADLFIKISNFIKLLDLLEDGTAPNRHNYKDNVKVIMALRTRLEALCLIGVTNLIQKLEDILCVVNGKDLRFEIREIHIELENILEIRSIVGVFHEDLAERIETILNILADKLKQAVQDSTDTINSEKRRLQEINSLQLTIIKYIPEEI